MADFDLSNVIQAIAVQGAINSPSNAGTDYKKFLATVIPPQIPVLGTVNDEQMVGDGFSRVMRALRNTYWQDKPFKISGLLNDHIAAILLNGLQGGAVTVTPRAAPSKDIAAVMNVINANPRLFSLYRHIGGDLFIHSSMAVNRFAISQEADPTFDCDLLGTGHYLDADQIQDNGLEEGDLAEAPEYQYFHGAATEVTATDGVETYNWTASGELQSLSIETGNSIVINKRPGDTFKDAANRNSGAFARKIRMGKATGNAKLKIDLGSDLRTFKSMVAGRKLTGLTFVFNGFNKIAGTTDEYEFEIKAPKSQFEMIEGETDQDFGALSLSIMPLRDAVTKGLFTNRTRTSNTLI